MKNLLVVLSACLFFAAVEGNAQTEVVLYGKVYKTVKIGKQVWMAENLNYKTGNSWCYDNDPANCKRYGRLYDWYTAMVACPEGWHLPSDDEWQELIDFLGGDQVAYRKLKSRSGWEFGGGNNSSGFSGLPGGSRYFSGNFYYLGFNAYFWSSNDDYGYNGWVRILGYGYEPVDRYYITKDRGLSCRCVRD